MYCISSKKVRIRKPHKCWGCTTEFPIGTELERKVSIDSGVIITGYWCDSCEKYLAKLPQWVGEDGWMFGELAQYKKDYSIKGE